MMPLLEGAKPGRLMRGSYTLLQRSSWLLLRWHMGLLLLLLSINVHLLHQTHAMGAYR